MSTQTKTDFALDMFQALPKDANLFFSPYSVKAAMARVAVGARGKTRGEMENVLGLEHRSDEELMRAIADWESDITAVNELTLEIANRLYAERSYNFRREYLTLMGKHADLETVDFRQNFERVRQDINTWVEQMTHDRIKDLLAPGSLDDMTKMVLVNAIYFLGKWVYQFDKNQTKPGDFRTASGKTIKAQFMYQKNSMFLYSESENMQALMMPYKGNQFAMLVLLPRVGTSLSAIESLAATSGLFQIFRSMHPIEDLEVYFPKFEMNWGTTDLTPALESLGIVEAFGDRADFGGMTSGAKELYISGVYHKAFVKVDEEGTEAAAATAVAMRFEAMFHNPVFQADHPFMFAIINHHSGDVLFLGRVTDPS